MLLGIIACIVKRGISDKIDLMRSVLPTFERIVAFRTANLLLILSFMFVKSLVVLLWSFRHPRLVLMLFNKGTYKISTVSCFCLSLVSLGKWIYENWLEVLDIAIVLQTSLVSPYCFLVCFTKKLFNHQQTLCKILLGHWLKH